MEEGETLVMGAALWHTDSYSKPFFHIFSHVVIYQKATLVLFKAPGLRHRGILMSHFIKEINGKNQNISADSWG